VANVLVIDDDPAVRTTIEIVLKREGHNVVLANNGQKGLLLFQANQFDLLIVDIFMPDMDGLETIGLVHKHRPGTPIIVISGYYTGTGPAPDFLNMATKLGAFCSLQKPFRPVELLTAVARCLDDSVDSSSATKSSQGNIPKS
jgi:DNA-binding NtrC family response regulator